jgi:hypothetical protein
LEECVRPDPTGRCSRLHAKREAVMITWELFAAVDIRFGTFKADPESPIIIFSYQ